MAFPRYQDLVEQIAKKLVSRREKQTIQHAILNQSLISKQAWTWISLVFSLSPHIFTHERWYNWKTKDVLSVFPWWMTQPSSSSRAFDRGENAKTGRKSREMNQESRIRGTCRLSRQKQRDVSPRKARNFRGSFHRVGGIYPRQTHKYLFTRLARRWCGISANETITH